MSTGDYPPQGPRDPRHRDWRDRWDEQGDSPDEGLDHDGFRDDGGGYADATERLSVTGDSGDRDYRDDYRDAYGDDHGDGHSDGHGGDGHRGYGGEPDEGGPDIVRDFFEAHRAQIREHQADDLTWQHIRRQARGGGSSRRPAWLAGAAAAAGIGVIALVLSQAFKGGDEPPSPAPPSVSISDDAPSTGPQETEEPSDDGTTGPTTEEPTDDGGTAPAPTTEEPTTDAAAPGTTDAGEETTGGPETPGDEPTDTEDPQPPAVDGGWAYPAMGLGNSLASIRTQLCDDGSGAMCTMLYLSEDGGETWGEPVGLDAEGISNVDRTEDVLWGWGEGGLKRSDDLGATWTEVPHRGEQVLRVNIWPDEMVVLTGDCRDRSCTDVELAILDPQTEDATEGEATTLGDMMTTPDGIRRTESAVYLTVPGQVPEDGMLWRVPVDGGEATSMRPAEQCSGGPLAWADVTGVPRSEDDLIMACQAYGPEGAPTDVELLRSEDGGATWEPLGTPPVPAPGMCGLASGNGEDIILAAQDGVWVSHDAGDTFRQTLEHPRSTECRLSSPVFGSGTTYLAQAASGTGDGNPAAYYRSTDAGDTWHYVIVD